MRVLPENTEIPESPSNYMKFKSGDNRFRIVSEGIVGNELWVSGKPVRNTLQEPFIEDELQNADINKFTGKKKVPQYFWAFPVFNYETKQVEILEITQKKVMKGIEGYLNDDDYGEDATKYDFVVNRDDESDPVSYSVRAKPPKSLDKGVQEYVGEMTKNIKLEALYKGEDPFADDDYDANNPEEAGSTAEDFDIPDEELK